MNYTPGPWQFIREDGDRKIVAPSTQPALRTRETLMCDTNYYPWFNNSDADWSLIAAAPDLLEALKWAMSNLQEVGGEDNPKFLQARAAIAKAEGK